MRNVNLSVNRNINVTCTFLFKQQPSLQCDEYGVLRILRAFEYLSWHVKNKPAELNLLYRQPGTRCSRNVALRFDDYNSSRQEESHEIKQNPGNSESFMILKWQKSKQDIAINTQLNKTQILLEY